MHLERLDGGIFCIPLIPCLYSKRASNARFAAPYIHTKRTFVGTGTVILIVMNLGVVARNLPVYRLFQIRGGYGDRLTGTAYQYVAIRYAGQHGSGVLGRNIAIYNKMYCVPKLPVASVWRSEQTKLIASRFFENEIAIAPINRRNEVKVGSVSITTYRIGWLCFIRKRKSEFTAVSRHLKNGLIDLVLVEVIRTYVELGRQVFYPVSYGKRNILRYTGATIRHACIK